MERPSAHTRRLVGGALCLDFANSVDWERDGSERPAHADVLAGPADLAIWGARLGLAPTAAPPLVRGRELSAARSLRRAIHDVFAAIAHGEAPEEGSISQLEGNYADAIAAARLIAGDEDWGLDWPEDDPRRIRFAVAVDALDLLCNGEQLARVRMCPGNNCGWLFLDRTGRRRWCSMEVCGSRAKMRRLYERRRGHA
jgi:predicted RNA-binding Zn ribbon-like protein